MGRGNELTVAIELLKASFSNSLSREECDTLVGNIILSVNKLFDYYD